jgi:DNA polymerase elongation subunit (family B)
MAMIRASMPSRKKIIPPTIRAYEVARAASRYFPAYCSRAELAEKARQDGKARLGDGFVRMIKYGEEMPPWIEYHHILPGDAPEIESDIPNEEFGGDNGNDDEQEDEVGRRVILPGGLTIHPDELGTQMLLYWNIVAADVGAMYPTILKARNIGADTVRLCTPDEEPNEWVWLRWAPKSFLDPERIRFRPVNEKDDPYARGEGYAFAVRIEGPERSPSMISLAMSGILKIISQVKRKSKEVDADPKSSPADKRKWKMMYASLKALRNAGTHGILAAPMTSGRQFNLFGGGCITTEGQRILNDVAERLNKANAMVAYGDTDGIYIPCSRSSKDAPDELYRVLSTPKAPGMDQDKFSICDAERVKKIIRECNELWRKRLNYPDFELEIEEADAALFVKHKNYLLWEVKGDALEMTTKGNNFKGSDKPNLARKVLERIMRRVLAENLAWENVQEGRARLIESIVNATEEEIKQMDVTQVSEDDLILIQTVRSPDSYKKVGKESKKSIFTLRSEAIEKLLSTKINTSVKMRFMVSKQGLPGIEDPTKSDVKPIDYMYPVESLRDGEGNIMWDRVDLDWYRTMIRSYVFGAFGIRKDESGAPTSATLDAFTRGEPKIAKPEEKKKVEEKDENKGQTTLARFM